MPKDAQNKFRVVTGIHIQDGKKYTKGQVVESPHDLIKLFPQKFTRVGGEPESTSPKDWDEEEKAEELRVGGSRRSQTDEEKPAPHKSTHAPHVPSRTMRDK
jgi:hypothetical protein